MKWTDRLVRARVPLSWAVGLAALLLAEPTPLTYGVGLCLAAGGEVWRTWAAGHLRKGEGLTRSGPYAWTRNPLYLGSVLVGMGFALATARWEVVALLLLLFVAVYLPVIRTEAGHLAEKYPVDYAVYADRVPLLLPCPPRNADSHPASDEPFSWRRVWLNKEHLTWLGCVAVAVFLGLLMN